MVQKRIKKMTVVILSFIITVTCFTKVPIFASMPAQDDSAVGQAYDGIDFDELMKSRIYFGAMNQATDFDYIFYGHAAKTWEQNTTPILWRVVGEDGDQSGNKDGAIAIFSEYVIDAMKFTATGHSVWYEWSGEGDYHASYVQNWLNNESTYKDRKGFGNSFKITENDASISYDAELNTIVRSNVDTYFIAQGKPSSASQEVVVTNPGDVYLHTTNFVSHGEWTSYFGRHGSPFDNWPVTQNNSIAYIPTGVYSYPGLPSHNKLFYNSDGLPKTTTSPDYTIGTMGSGEDIVLGKTKYGDDSLYWLRSPNGTVADSSSTRAYSVDERGYLYQAPTAADGAGVRPITKLDPKSIVMTHEIIASQPTLSNQIQADKQDNTEWNYEASTDNINNYKLTIVSDKVKLNSLKDANNNQLTSKLKVEPGETIKVISDDYIGDYLAYKIVHKNENGKREIVGYGTSKGSSPDELEIKGIKSTIDNSNLEEGEYTLYVWAQREDTAGKDSTSVHSYEASNTLSYEFSIEKKTLYTITYDGNTHTHGSAPVDSKNPYVSGSSVTILDENDLKKDDHSFVGWSTSPTGTVEYTHGSTHIITQHIILYAQWRPVVNYTVTFVSNGGTYVAPQTGLNLNDYVIKPTDPTKENHKFLGWYLDDQTFLNKWDFDNDTIVGDTTLYAKWEKDEPPVDPSVKYTVTFVSNGGTYVAPQTGLSLNDYVIEPTDPTKNEHIFLGWYLDNQSFLDKWDFDKDTINGDTTLYAKWENKKPPVASVKYNVTFISNGGTYVDPQTGLNLNDYIIEPTDPTKNEYKFLGWYLDDQTFLDKWDFDKDTIVGDTVLYAKWENKKPPIPTVKYTVTFESNGGTHVASQTGLNLHDYVIEPTDPTKKEHIFLGWYLDDQTFLDKWDFDKDTINGDTTLYAKWEKQSPSISPPRPIIPKPTDPNKPNPSTVPPTSDKTPDNGVASADETNMAFYVVLLLLSSYIIRRKKSSIINP